MKILLDIGHPAHVHYFRNAVKILEQKGHEFLITTRDKEVTLDLLRKYGFNYICTGKNKAGTFNKFTTLIRNEIKIYGAARKFKPDMFLSFFSPFAAHVGFLKGKTVVGFTDTEFARFSIKITKPFCTHIFTPQCFRENLGKNHYRFNGYMESFYLDRKYFTPDKSVFKFLGLKEDEKFYIMRFVSFNAGHDTGETGIDEQSKLKIAELLAASGRLFISSEGSLPSRFEQYKLSASPEQFHNILAFAQLYIGEGITTAAECALLGTPAVLINTLTTGYIDEHVKNKLLYRYSNAAEAMPLIEELIETPSLKKENMERAAQVHQNNIDCTGFLVSLIDDYPQSIAEL
jgi:uncharacterized protein